MHEMAQILRILNNNIDDFFEEENCVAGQKTKIKQRKYKRNYL